MVASEGGRYPGGTPWFTLYSCTELHICSKCQHSHFYEVRYAYTTYDGGCLAKFRDYEALGYSY
jgi:hypothetical protein